MNNLNGYVNVKTNLDLIRLNIDRIKTQELKLKEEKNMYLKLKKEYEVLLLKMREKLKECKGVEYDLLYEIVVKGSKVTRAVDKVAFTYDLDVSTIWKNYYPKVKLKLKELDTYISNI